MSPIRQKRWSAIYQLRPVRYDNLEEIGRDFKAIGLIFCDQGQDLNLHSRIDSHDGIHVTSRLN